MAIYIGNDTDLKATGMQDENSGTYLNSLTISWSLVDGSGTQVSGGSGTLAYVAASNGNYFGVMDAAVTSLLTLGATYTLIMTVTGGGYDRKDYIDHQAIHRTGV